MRDLDELELSYSSGGGSSQSEYSEVWLLGQPPLQEYLEFIEEMAIGQLIGRAALVVECRAPQP